MSRSVPSLSEVQATFAAALFDEWILLGLRDVVLSPGSRSTPLALAAIDRDELTLHVRLDERSAGFFAIGRSLESGLPVVVVTTSGTAAAELHACVAEADQALVPLIIVTADRPPELRGIGAPQTITQTRLYGEMVRAFEEPGVARAESADGWRVLARGLWRRALGAIDPAGPVHLNASFVEPLVAGAYELPARDHDDAPCATEAGPLELDCRGRSVLCVVGAGASDEVVDECRALKWVVLGDATSRGTLAYYDAMLRSDAFAANMRPDLVVRVGGVPASKVLLQRWRDWDVRTVGLRDLGPVADPERLVTSVLSGRPDRGTTAQMGEDLYVERWTRASRSVAKWLATLETEDATLNEPLVARALVERSSLTSTPLVVGSSMPVRDVEWWSPPRRERTFANRGVNGIDGVVSTVLGVAAGSVGLGLVGDLTMLHDVSGLVEGLGRAGGTCVLVVVDNAGGGIFSFLSQATQVPTERFERLFGTPRPHDLEDVARAFGHAATSVATRGELSGALDKGLAAEGLSVIVARVPDRPTNVAVHQSWNEHVATLLARGLS